MVCNLFSQAHDERYDDSPEHTDSHGVGKLTFYHMHRQNKVAIIHIHSMQQTIAMMSRPCHPIIIIAIVISETYNSQRYHGAAHTFAAEMECLYSYEK